MRVFDCFMFFNEFEALDIRLHELSPYVDRFVLVESEQTFTGHNKPMLFSERKKEFREFLPKITHLVSPPVTDVTVAPRGRERVQRDWAVNGLLDLDPDDWIIMGDVDEIPKLPIPYGTGSEFYHYRQLQHFYFLNLRGPVKRSGTTAMTGRHFMSRFDGNVGASRGRLRWEATPIEDGGWHFTFLGGAERVVWKYQSYCHQEIIQANPRLGDVNYVRELMDKGLVTIGAPYKGNLFPKFIPIDETFPKYIRENKEKFKNLIRE